MALKDRLKKSEERLDAYYEAEMAVLAGQEYKIGTRSLTRADLQEIRAAIKNLEKKVDQLESAIEGSGRRNAYRITIRDL